MVLFNSINWYNVIINQNHKEMKTQKTIHKETDKQIEQIFTYLEQARLKCRNIALKSSDNEVSNKFNILQDQIHLLINTI